VEGFRKDQATVSVMTVHSLRSISGSSVESYLKEIARAMKGAYNAEARTWGEENLVLLNPAAFDVIRQANLSRAEVQRKLHQAGRVPCSQFAQYKGAPIPLKDLPKIAQIPDEIVSRCRESMENSVAVVPRPEDLKIIVAGGRTGGTAYFVDTWGFGKSFFTTREIKLPPHWDQLLKKYNGGSTPVIK